MNTTMTGGGTVNAIETENSYRTGAGFPYPNPTWQGAVRAYANMGLHLVAVRSGSKVPASSTWRTDPSLTAREAIDHVVGGGNLAMHTGKSGKAVFDVDSSEGIASVGRAGFEPVTVTPRGAHYWIDAESYDDVVLGLSCAVGDVPHSVLAGDRIALLAPSRLAG